MEILQFISVYLLIGILLTMLTEYVNKKSNDNNAILEGIGERIIIAILWPILAFELVMQLFKRN